MEPTSHNAINSPTAVELRALNTVATRLEEAGLETKRFCQIHEQKRSFTHHQALYHPDDLPAGNYGVKGIGDLVIIDVDDWDETPDGLKTLLKEKPTFAVETPHADGKEGHYYYRCTGSVPDESPDWGDVQSVGSLAVGPGSQLESCNKADHYCSLPGRGEYVIKEDRQIAALERAELPIRAGADENDGEESISSRNATQCELPEYDQELADVGATILRDLNAENTTAHVTLKTLLEGDVGRYADDLLKPDGDIDRSEQENLALLLLYGTIRRVGKVEDQDRAKRILCSTFEDYLQAHPHTEDGQERKWLERREDYRANRVDSAIRDFDDGRFTRFLNLSSTPIDYRFYSGKCSEVNFNFGRLAVDLLSGRWDVDDVGSFVELCRIHYNLDIGREAVEELLPASSPPSPQGGGKVVESIHPLQNHERYRKYPTCEGLFEAVKMLGSNLGSKDSFRTNVLSELQETGMVKHAYCPTRPNGQRHVYYSPLRPNPDDAVWVRTEGEQRCIVDE